MPETEHKGRKVYWESHGEGDTLVMIRGFGSSADHWYAQVPAFSKFYRVIIFDNRAIARSSDPGGSFTIKDMAEDTIGLMDALDLDSAHVLGLSMGGMIAQEMAIHYPSRVKGLILAVTHCGGKQYVPPAKRVTQAFQRLVDEGSPESRMEAFSYLFAPQILRRKQQIVQEYITVSMAHPARQDVLKRQWDAVLGHDACDRLQLIKAETLILTGSADVLVPPVNSTIMAEWIPRSELVIIQGGGHQVLIEQPDACNQAVIGFLRKFATKADEAFSANSHQRNEKAGPVADDACRKS